MEGREMKERCLTDEELKKVFQDDKASSDYDSFVKHINRCGSCNQRYWKIVDEMDVANTCR